jgi:hypothetical protein
VKNLSGTPLFGRLLALTVNTSQGWKDLPATNTAAYLALSLFTMKKVL